MRVVVGAIFSSEVRFVKAVNELEQSIDKSDGKYKNVSILEQELQEILSYLNTRKSRLFAFNTK